jgi:(1->4)-alpha-D-glucan 1-alpha-D-glucosylmutase
MSAPVFSTTPDAQNRETESYPASAECLDHLLHREARAPRSTYRLQMQRDFPFAAARSILPYLKKLGIGDVYCSPLTEARPGSSHGYDVTRHDRLNPELGGAPGFEDFSAELRRLGMGLLLDFVPNHMGVGNDSLWWQDVLENGHASQYAEYFDIDWHPLKTAMQEKLLLPILGRQYGAELESKHIRVAVKDGWPRIEYFGHDMPLSPRSLPLLFPERNDDRYGVPPEFRELLKQLPQLPPHDTADERERKERRRELGRLEPELRRALASPAMRPAIDKTLAAINGAKGDPHSFDRLHELLEAQPYRLALWSTSAEEINYRRFFDINDLVGLRMENPAVFAATHTLVRSLLASGKITGLRIDHCDGMLNPRQYLIRLQQLYLASQCCGEKPRGKLDATGIEREVLDHLRSYDWFKSEGPFYTVVEKILEPREYLPESWPVRGTSGYDFVYLANQAFVLSGNEKIFDALYTQVIGHAADPDDIIYRSKLQVMQTALASDVYALTNLLSQIASANRYARDFTDNILEAVLRQTIATFPVYRTYIDDRGEYSDRDVAFVRLAVARAKRLNPDIDASAFDFLRETLLLKKPAPEVDSPQRPDPQILYFALKFQQLTGPVMAKGVEDTAFYVYSRFLSSNEVGGSIKSFGISTDVLHQSNAERLKYSPDSMLATSTHDTKRSEDLRNRLNVLSEMQHRWPRMVRSWLSTNAKFKCTLEDGRVVPDRNEEYFLYQTIVGAWPWQMETAKDRDEFLERLKQYMAKALSEAKVHLSWVNPDAAYVEGVQSFVAAILAYDSDGAPGAFVRSVERLLPSLRLFGALNSLAQTVLKIASPGVPDFYQGSELWDLSLVDPDNRRPVDFNLRASCLDGMVDLAEREGPSAVCRDVLANLADGRVKMWTIHRALDLRTRRHSLLRRGEYIALHPTGAHQEHLIAFLRRDAATGESVLAVVPRFGYTMMQAKDELPLAAAWAQGRLILPESAAARYRNVFTGEVLAIGADRGLALSSIFATFPVALFESME